MKGYVAQKGNRPYAVIYDGLDPVTGRERPIRLGAGVDRADAKSSPLGSLLTSTAFEPEAVFFAHCAAHPHQ